MPRKWLAVSGWQLSVHRSQFAVIGYRLLINPPITHHQSLLTAYRSLLTAHPAPAAPLTCLTRRLVSRLRRTRSSIG
jgi:hypothetical protein